MPGPLGASRWDRARASLRDGYLSFDRRTLGLVRLMLGALLLLDLARRAPWWTTLYSSEGLAPADVTLAAQLAYENVSVAFAFDHPVASRALFALCALTFGALFVGYRTKLAQVAAVVLVTGLNGRLLLVENGGYVVENLLVTWTAFLPLGDRFSVDALLASLERGRGETLEDLATTARARPHEPFVSSVGLALVAQVWAIYFFNVVHKTGEGWRLGTAVHSVVHVDRMVTPLVAALREHVPWPAYLLATKATLWLEGLASVLAWAPLYRDHARRLLVVVMCALHLAFGLTFALGPFAWSMIVLAFSFLPGRDLERLGRALRDARRARTVLVDERSRLAFAVARVLARLDALDLLTFERRARLPAPLVVVGPRGPARAHAEGLAAVVAALPFGPLVGGSLTLPGVRALLEAGLAALFARDAGSVEGAVASALGLGEVPARGARGPAPPEPSPMGAFFARLGVSSRETLALVLLAACINQGAVELWVVKARFDAPQHPVLRALTLSPRLLQGWFMFSPNPVTDDSNVVVDALCVSGARVDPLTGKAPDFDLTGAKSFGYDQLASDYRNRIVYETSLPFIEPLARWLARHHERTGRPGDRVLRGEVWVLHDENPRFGSHAPTNLTKTLLFRFEADGAIELGPLLRRAGERAERAERESALSSAGATP